MQSHSRNRLENDDVDETDADDDNETIDADGFDTTVHVDVATGTVKFQAAWMEAADPPPETERHSVVLVLDCDTMERYADLDESTRMRVHAILRHTVQDLLDRQPDEHATLTIELTDAMLDAARVLQ